MLEALDLLRRNIERAHRLVQDFKKVAVRQLSDEKDNFDISQAIGETISLVSVSLNLGGIKIALADHLGPEQSSCFGSAGALSHIVINLLTNIERYAYPKGAGGVAEVDISLEGDQYLLMVRDFGKGIPERARAHVFEPFFTTGRAAGGTGLGLAIVHNLVTNSLRGTITFRSQDGAGTEFRVRFPRELSR